MYWYVKTTECEALMDLHEVPRSERPLLWRKLKKLESAYNDTRRTKKKPPKVRTKGR